MEDKQKLLRVNKKSTLWNFFTPVNEIKATCNFCKQTLSYKSSISNLKQHIERKHPSIKVQKNEMYCVPIVSRLSTASAPSTSYSGTSQSQTVTTISSQETEERQHMELMEPPTTSVPLMNACHSDSALKKVKTQATLHTPRKIGFNQKKRLDNMLLNLITKDFQPLSIVEDRGFQEFVYALNPMYTLPTRKTISNTLLPAKYLEVEQHTREMVENIKSATITTDYWTSCNNDGFIAVTAHFIDGAFQTKSIILEVDSHTEKHTSANITCQLKKIISHWGLETKILLAISDNAANIKKAITDLHWKHFGCYAHTLNLIVKDALELEVVRPIISKVSETVAYFKRSAFAKSRLDSYQTNNNKQPKKLIQCVVTRWNSVYYMLQRISELKEEVTATLATIGKEDWARLSHQDFEKIDELIEILAPMELTTKVISSENNVTLSLVIILTNGLTNVYEQLKQNSKFSFDSKSVLENISKGIATRFKNLESSTTLLMSTFLDPRFKHIALSSGSAVEKAKMAVTDAAVALIDKKYVKSHVNETVPVNHHTRPDHNLDLEPKPSKLSIWSDFDMKAANFSPLGIGNNRSKAIIEVQRYMEEPLLKRDGNPLHWWKNNQYNYPYLSELVLLKFGTVATSVPCERLFSKTGQLLSDRRNRLSSAKVKQIMFINMNSPN